MIALITISSVMKYCTLELSIRRRTALRKPGFMSSTALLIVFAQTAAQRLYLVPKAWISMLVGRVDQAGSTLTSHHAGR
jgi:hypothetical protein